MAGDWWSQGPLEARLDPLEAGEVTALHSHAVAGATPVNAVAALLTTTLTGTNNDMVFTAVTKGVAGNSITIAYVDPAVETATEVVTVTGTAIVVTLRSVSGVLSTAAQIKTAYDLSAAAIALATVANAGGNNGTGVVIAMSATPLAGGVNGTIAAAGEVRFDSSYLYLAVAANTVAGTSWRRVSLGSIY